jgi:dTDP-glucose 4,6-dehydratase
MKVLVTGAAGFLGSHLSDRFLSEGYSVVGVDNFLTGHSQNLAHLGDDPRFEFIEADVSERIPDVGPVDGVLHLASPASPVDYLAYPVSTMKVGSFGTFNALELARRHGARFFLASTSEVYGDPLEHPQVESYWGHVNPVGPRSVYDEAKRFSEALTMSYHREFGLETRIVRIFNTYGPRMRPRDGRVVTNFIVQALNGEPITVYGDGTQTRSFCYVSDEIEGLFRLFERGDHHPTNIGNPREHTMLELANIVVELTGTSSPVVFEALPQDDPRQRCPNITRARELLGWEPRVDVRDGIALTIEYFRALMGTERMQARA